MAFKARFYCAAIAKIRRSKIESKEKLGFKTLNFKKGLFVGERRREKIIRQK